MARIIWTEPAFQELDEIVNIIQMKREEQFLHIDILKTR